MALLMPHSPSQAHADVFGRGVETFLTGDRSGKNTTPSEVHNVDLWRSAWKLMNTHQPSAELDSFCNSCGVNWPCEPYRHGQADEVASRRQYF